MDTEISDLKDDINNIEPGLSDAAKTALLNCFQHVAWIDEHGQTYYDALESALYADSYPKITAVFNPNRDIYNIDSLDSIRAFLTVTVEYSEESSIIVNDYTLTGELNTGENTISVRREDLSTTFTVTVTDAFAVNSWSSSSDIAEIANGQTNLSATASNSINFVYNSEDTSGQIRKHLASEIGILKYNNYDETGVVDLYPIPVKAMCRSATITISPSSCYSFIKAYRYDPANNKYQGVGDALKWATGERTLDLSSWRVEGVNRFVCINLKADSAGTGQFATQPTITITYND